MICGAKKNLPGKQLATSSKDSKDDGAEREDFTADWAEENQAGVTHAVDFFPDINQPTQDQYLIRFGGYIPSGCLNLNWIKIQAVKSPNTPRKTMSTTPGTRPTTASDEGNESIPLLTISAIMSAATSSHDSVLYLIFVGGREKS